MPKWTYKIMSAGGKCVFLVTVFKACETELLFSLVSSGGSYAPASSETTTDSTRRGAPRHTFNI